jgi:hypothetical protein
MSEADSQERIITVRSPIHPGRAVRRARGYSPIVDLSACALSDDFAYTTLFRSQVVARLSVKQHYANRSWQFLVSGVALRTER